jgi:two-component system sensor histidine kinase DevS
MSADQPHLPRPVGLIAATLRGETLRLPDMARHPDSVGFPVSHVPRQALLGVPIAVSGRVLGGLYLTRSPASRRSPT